MCICNAFYLLHSYNPSFLICLCFNMVSFRGQKKLGPGPDPSPVGVFKISDEHPHPFHMWIPPPPPRSQYSSERTELSKNRSNLVLLDTCLFYQQNPGSTHRFVPVILAACTWRWPTGEKDILVQYVQYVLYSLHSYVVFFRLYTYHFFIQYFLTARK